MKSIVKGVCGFFLILMFVNGCCSTCANCNSLEPSVKTNTKPINVCHRDGKQLRCD